MLAECFEVHDQVFRSLIFDNVQIEKLWSDGRWTEGPVYVPAGKYLLFSDIPNDRVMRWDETNNAVSLFDHKCGFQNGHTLDVQGRVLACEHGGRRVSRCEPDGSLTILASEFQGKRLNSPNDLVVKSDGSIWFTDPTYGIDSYYEGHKAVSEIKGSHVYRVDPDTKSVDIVASDFVQPNGIAFGLNESRMFIVDSGASHRADGPRHIRAFDVDSDGKSLGNGRILSTCDNGIYDGVRVDELGNLWVGAGDGVQCISPDGKLLGKIRIPETAANVEFGGPSGNRLFICATQSLYSIFVNVRGIRWRARDV